MARRVISAGRKLSGRRDDKNEKRKEASSPLQPAASFRPGPKAERGGLKPSRSAFFCLKIYFVKKLLSRETLLTVGVAMVCMVVVMVVVATQVILDVVLDMMVDVVVEVVFLDVVVVALVILVVVVLLEEHAHPDG